MKTYPYQDGDRLIELVEKREYNLLASERADLEVLVDKLAMLRAEDMATINDLRKKIEIMENYHI
jgi:hypothetical protein